MKGPKNLWLCPLFVLLAIITFFLFRLQVPSKNAHTASAPETSQKASLQTPGSPGKIDPLLHYTDTTADAKYPKNEWIAMLQEKGVTIETNQDYWRYMSIREDLVHLENDSEAWESGWPGVPKTTDWSIYKSAYIDRQIWETQQIQHAQKSDPEIVSGIFGGPDHKTFLPLKHNTLYVKRDGLKTSFHGALFRDQTQEFNLIFRGIEPEGYDIIYLDSNNNILSEQPPLITREELLNSGGDLPPEGWWEGDFTQ